jgi:predicted enzyme related to lactoylglutathione lyase
MKMNPVVHFEMPYKDGERASEFYTKAFGWETRNLGKEMMDYITVDTSETDDKRMIKNPGMINGGLFPYKEDWPAQYPSIVIAVDDIDEHIKIVTDAGGEVLGHPVDIPGIGKYVSFLDTEGNRVSMLQPRDRIAE